jgi:hypothetical protein
MAIFMETTQIDDAKTVAEIQHLLAKQGATSVMVEYAGGSVESLCGDRLNVLGHVCSVYGSYGLSIGKTDQNGKTGKMGGRAHNWPRG